MDVSWFISVNLGLLSMGPVRIKSGFKRAPISTDKDTVGLYLQVFGLPEGTLHIPLPFSTTQRIYSPSPRLSSVS